MANWYNNDLLTRPQALQMTVGELLPVSWDMTDLLLVGESVTNPVVTVTRIDTKPLATVPLALSGSAAVNGNSVIQSLDGSALVRDALYEILVTFDAAVGKTIAVMTMLECIA